MLVFILIFVKIKINFYKNVCIYAFFKRNLVKETDILTNIWGVFSSKYIEIFLQNYNETFRELKLLRYFYLLEPVKVI